ncbi:NAD(P)H-dependent glycerol-3-phosphate dehydrogenase [Evansella cellulosilytica]|uniref:Glycerol-3-phosphate dehydrogenase [NAD(P)+] n=1 Tax=Evansella cellulosilytica (strain ATCC 21833 / DSM 2522 / FERM P-1141 / JCM 9156 / N-4) TaxID=649639 RepID=E6TZE5_EVAC2|nr:NAD(P)H-dependent glycerol-3-phosphate dehydrogenase [Evansella cellulosilytica]ADU30119.1 NAD-dependent glycerol-3-phosphate dehydrogenase domain protein [Evansella cellulosilytica DSM 2522]
MAKIAVLGAGSWGTALALVLADNKHDVHIWGRYEEQVNEINVKHQNNAYLPNITLPNNLIASTSIEAVLEGAEAVLLVVPTKAMREVLQSVKQNIKKPMTFIHASKGIEPGTHLRISQIIEEEIPFSLRSSVVVLSGPSHAEEVSLRQPTTVTTSSEDMEAASYVQDLFMNKHFRVYTNPDLIGVEIGGSLKNIIALGAGLTHGLGFGDNAKAALMTRGLTEIARLGVKLGANPLTFAGLSGLGDLIVTCTSVHSRNWRAGNMLGKGENLQNVLDEMGMVVEGIRTTKAAYEISNELNVDMPITRGIYDVLFHNKSPEEAVSELMGRVKKKEVEDLKLDNIIFMDKK